MTALIMSHPTGNANVRAVLAALDREQLLHTFFTTVGIRSGNTLVQLLPEKYRRQARKREYATTYANIVFHPERELLRLLGRADIDEVYSNLDHFVALRLASDDLPVNGVYGYEDGALKTFEEAKRRGMTCFYDLPIAYWETAQQLLREEAQRLPAWEPTLVGTRDSEEKLRRKTRELELADVVFVPSSFVEESLPTAIRQTRQIIRAEFGSPPDDAAPQTSGSRRETAASEKLRVLFAGSLTQRKGLADVFEAMKLLRRTDVELVVMGSTIAPLDFYREQFPEFTYEPPRPHAQVLDLMRRCDVFVLPSLVEGRALVQQEAMACGLPLIVTPNAGGADLIDEGQTGFLVPIRSPRAIAEKIAWLADHRAELPRLRDAARRKAAGYTWEKYGARICQAVRQCLREEAVA